MPTGTNQTYDGYYVIPFSGPVTHQYWVNFQQLKPVFGGKSTLNFIKHRQSILVID